MTELNILIAVRYQILRDGIEMIVDDESDLHIKGIAKDCNEIFELPLDKADLLILDLDMPDLDAGDFISELLDNYSGLKVLAISESKTPVFVKEVMQAGASGYIFKRQNSNELIEAIRQIGHGEKFLCDKIIRLLIEGKNKAGNGRNKHAFSADLTDRELEVLELICQEFTNREIAEKLHISVRTVDAHRRNILQKTGAKNTAGLVKYAIKHQIYNM